MLQKLTCCILLATVLCANAQKVPQNTGSKLTKEEAQASLDFHNKVRKDVGVGSLQWSAELAAFAQSWADKLVNSGCKLEHRPASGKWAQQYGENIFFGMGKEITVLNASAAWYGEIKDFKNGKLTTSNWTKVAHYTQMVWNTTTSMGMGKATCPSGAIIVVANYNPRGNYMGEKPY
jgi:pathogenesis-related protein 1